MSNDRSLDRKSAVPAIVGDPDDLLIVCGLAGASKDMAHLTNDGDNIFTMAGAMGGLPRWVLDSHYLGQTKRCLLSQETANC